MREIHITMKYFLKISKIIEDIHIIYRRLIEDNFRKKLYREIGLYISAFFSTDTMPYIIFFYIYNLPINFV